MLRGLGAENCQYCTMFMSHCEVQKLRRFCFIKLHRGCFLVHPSILQRETHCKKYFCKLAGWLCKAQSRLHSSAPSPTPKWAVPNSTGKNLRPHCHPAGSEWTTGTSKMEESQVSSWRAREQACTPCCLRYGRKMHVHPTFSSRIKVAHVKIPTV